MKLVVLDYSSRGMESLKSTSQLSVSATQPLGLRKKFLNRSLYVNIFNTCKNLIIKELYLFNGVKNSYTYEEH